MTRSLTSLFVALTMLAALAVVPAVHAQGVPGFDANKCLAKKNKCVSKKIKGLMKCREKCQQKPDKCGAVQDACDQKVMDKFDGGANPAKGCFEKLEAKADPMKPESVCTTTGDTASMGAEVDASIADLVARLEGTPAPTCGDGAVNVLGEECDGGDLAGADCTTLGFDSGALGCTGGCLYDTSACVAATCGDGVLNVAGEHCDGADLGGSTCSSLTQGLFVGDPGCTGSCRFDMASCATCGSAGGVTVGGACWFLGSSGASCDATCLAAGLSYDPATRTYAGSDGTGGQCASVLDALLGPSHAVTPTDCTVNLGGAPGLGCFVIPALPGAGFRCFTPPTSSTAALTDIARACACD